MKKTCIIKFKKIGTQVVPVDNLMKLKLKNFVDNLTDKDEIECLFEAVEPNNTKSQLAKIHVMIKEISDETGETLKQTKLNIKDQVGLTYYVDNKKIYKSFADETRESLSNIIEKLYIVGDFLNINFKKDFN
tara:strand:+ start:98 stop:493 length:396 start_codon:yes stop_codon:yes gene_type:complete